MDDEGMICESLEPLILKYKPRFIYVNPDFQNPTGIVMSMKRRKALLSLSHKYKLPVIEEDAASEIRFEGVRIPSLKALDKGNNVIFIYSFALTFAPGIRRRLFWRQNPDQKPELYRFNPLISLDSISQQLLSSLFEKGYLSEKSEKYLYGLYGKKGSDVRLSAGCSCHGPGISQACRRRNLWCNWRRISIPSGIHKVNGKGRILHTGNIFYLKGSNGDSYIRRIFPTPASCRSRKGFKFSGSHSGKQGSGYGKRGRAGQLMLRKSERGSDNLMLQS